MKEQTEQKDAFYSKIEKIVYDAVDNTPRTWTGKIKPSEMRTAIRLRSTQILELVKEYDVKIQNYETQLQEKDKEMQRLIETGDKLEKQVIELKETESELETNFKEAQKKYDSIIDELVRIIPEDKQKSYLQEIEEAARAFREAEKKP